MNTQKALLILTIIGLMATVALAQERHVVIHKELSSRDSTEYNVIVNSDVTVDVLGDSSDHHFWIQRTIDGLDSLGENLIFTEGKHIELLGDSMFNNIFIRKLPHLEERTARIIIKKSGFFRKNKIIIDFNPMTQQIIQVVDNGKTIPENKFHKYQDHLEDATEYAELESLHPRMEELEMKIDMLQLPDSEKLAELEALLIDLEDFDSDRAHFKKQHYASAIRVIELDNLEEEIQNILSDAGVTPPQKIKEIAIEDGKFYLNGEALKGEIAEKCIQLYIDNSDLTNEDLNKKGEEISVKITFH